MFAAALLDKSKKVEKPDLESHSLIRFLDKFVYRNAKSTDPARGASIMQPLRAAKDSGDIWLGSRGAGSGTVQVNSASFWNKKAEDVAAEDIFFHNYFQNVSKEPKEPKKQPNSAGADDDEEQEDEVWKALVSTHPDGDMEGSEDGFDDFDDEEMASLDGSSPALSLDEESDGGVDIEGDDDMGMDDAGSDDNPVELFDDEDEGDEEELDGDEDGEDDKPESRSSKDRKRRKMLKNLPTFASVDDYAEMLANEEDEDF